MNAELCAVNSGRSGGRKGIDAWDAGRQWCLTSHNFELHITRAHDDIDSTKICCISGGWFY